MNRLLYISDTLLSELEVYFDKFKKRNYKWYANMRADIENDLFKDRWTSIESLYRSIYLINLFDQDLIHKNDNIKSKNNQFFTAGTLTLVYNRDLPLVDASSNFQDSLIDDKIVADFAKLRLSVEDATTAELVVSAVGIGCLWLEFSVVSRVPQNQRSIGPADRIEEMEKEIFFSQASWSSIKERFDLGKDDILFERATP